MRRRSLVASLVSALALVVALAAWIAFAPAGLGGQAAYVIVAGNSMEPGMHRGDLAVVRDAHAYSEGDVVTYRHPDIGPVIHRVIGREGDRYVLKGDHNDFVDSFKPETADIVGKLWFHIPSAGRLISPLQQHRNLFVLLALSVALLGGALGAATRDRAMKTGERRNKAASQRRQTLGETGRYLEEGFGVLCATALAFAALAVYSLWQPASRQVPDDISYTQSGAFSYSAATENASIYDAGAAVTGDPVFRRLSDTIDFQFDYSFASKHAGEVQGVQRLFAEVSDDRGWKRTIELQPAMPFEGSSFAVEAILQLDVVDAVLQRFEAETGVHSTGYTVTIAPQVDVNGTLDGRDLRDAFAPRLTFTLDEFQLSLPRRSATDPDPVAPSAAGVLRGVRAETNTLNLFVTELAVPTARWLALSCASLAMAGAGALALGPLRRRALTQDSPRSRAARHGVPIVPVRDVPVARGALVDVISVDDLASIAMRQGGVILQVARPGCEAYFAHEGARVYRYQVREDGRTIPGGAAA